MSDVELITKAFHKYDEGGKNYLSSAEVEKLLNDLAKAIGFQGGVKSTQMSQVMDILDANRDGNIDLEELLENIKDVGDALDFKFNPIFLKKILA